jgi:hypothetical protein
MNKADSHVETAKMDGEFIILYPFVLQMDEHPFADYFGDSRVHQGSPGVLTHTNGKKNGDTHNGIIEINPQMNHIAQMGLSQFFFQRQGSICFGVC